MIGITALWMKAMAKPKRDAVEIAYQSLNQNWRYWLEPEVPGYAEEILFGPIKLLSKISGPVIECEGFKFVRDGDDRLVPRMGGWRDEWHNIYDDTKGRRLIAKATTGDQVAQNILCAIATRFVESGCSMPAHLRKYIATYLREQSRKAPERRRGRDPYANYYRDTKIASVVRELVDLGYQPTRNRASDNNRLVLSWQRRWRKWAFTSLCLRSKRFGTHIVGTRRPN